MFIDLPITRFEWKILIHNCVAYETTVSAAWLTIVSINGQPWSEIGEFPGFTSQCHIEYRNRLTELTALDSVDDLATWLAENPDTTIQAAAPYFIGTFHEPTERYYNIVALNAKFTMQYRDDPAPQLPPVPTKWLMWRDACRDLAAIEPTVSMSPFIRTRATILSSMPLDRAYTLGELFDQIQPSARVPFAAWNGLYKLHAPSLSDIDSKPWSQTTPLAIVCEVRTASGFCEGLISIQENTVEWLIMGDESSETFETDIVAILGIPRGAVQTREVNFGGEFYLPNTHINRTVIADLILTHPLLRQFVFVDESAKISREKETLYLYYAPTFTPETLLLSAHAGTRMDLVELINVPGQSTDSSVQLRIHKITSMDYVRLLAAFMERLFTVFMDKEAEIIADYARGGFDISARQTRPLTAQLRSHQRDQIKLKYHAPEIFTLDYPKLCTHQPSIVQPGEVLPPGQQTFNFPSEAEAADQQVTVHTYTCKHATHPFPGIRNNTLSNKDRFPCLPCCYRQDQRLKPRSRLNMYLETGQCDVLASGGQIATSTTLRVLAPNTFGHLPQNLAGLLLTWYPGSTMLRHGVWGETDTLLCCVARAKYGAVTSDAIIHHVETFKQQLAAFPGAPQNEYGRPIWGFLSQIVQLNIWIWGATPDGGCLLPPITFPLICHIVDPAWPHIHIFENRGNETSILTSYRFELIVDRQPAQIVVQFTETTDLIVDLARQIWQVQLGGRIIDPLEANPDLTGVASQILDSNGMRRAFVLTNDEIRSMPTPRFPVQLPVVPWPRQSVEQESSVFAHFNRQKQLARVILWNAYWYIQHHVINIQDLATAIVVDPSREYICSPRLPNPTIIDGTTFFTPEDITQQLLQVIHREIPQTVPATIPDYFTSLADLHDHPDQLITAIFPIAPYRARNPRLAPPFIFDGDGFFVQLGSHHYYATPAVFVESDEIPCFIWTVDSAQVTRHTYNPRESTDVPKANWLFQWGEGVTRHTFRLALATDETPL